MQNTGALGDGIAVNKGGGPEQGAEGWCQNCGCADWDAGCDGIVDASVVES